MERKNRMGSLEEARKEFAKDRYATVLSGIEIDEVGDHCTAKRVLSRTEGDIVSTMLV